MQMLVHMQLTLQIQLMHVNGNELLEIPRSRISLQQPGAAISSAQAFFCTAAHILASRFTVTVHDRP